MIYVTLPDNFIATKYPGYFINIDDTKVYSIKSGILKPIKYQRARRYHNYFIPAGYRVSVNGISKIISDEYIERLINKPKKSIINVKENCNDKTNIT